MKQSLPILTIPLPCNQIGGIQAHRFIGGTGARVQSIGGAAIGVTTHALTSDEVFAGSLVGVDVIGTTVVEAGGLITMGIGAPIKSDASGRAIDRNGTGNLLGYALGYATAAGQLVEILLVQNA